jgi:hypothetical protein
VDNNVKFQVIFILAIPVAVIVITPEAFILTAIPFECKFWQLKGLTLFTPDINAKQDHPFSPLAVKKACPFVNADEGNIVPVFVIVINPQRVPNPFVETALPVIVALPNLSNLNPPAACICGAITNPIL